MQLDALETMQQQIAKLFEDPTGLWIIAKHHQELNEYELIVEQKHTHYSHY